MTREAETIGRRAPEPRLLFAGDGEVAARMRALDWSQTPLGPVERWAPSLRAATDICLASAFPMVLFWGPELALLYNDAYLPVLGPLKHPGALGRPAAEIWSEIWDVIGPMLHGVLKRREATFSNDLLLMIDRDGVEESYFTFSYSPVSGEDGAVAGVFCAVTETTGRVLGERRLRTLRELAAASAEARSVEEACARAVASLAGNRSDLPFVSLYLLDAEGGGVVRVFGDEPCVRHADVERAARTGEPAPVGDLHVEVELPLVGAATATSAVLLPLPEAGREAPQAVLVAGVSPVRKPDGDYRAFFDLVAGQVATALAAARASEAERERVERLAALDRAKTEFFSNVSHEFRTPLTLLLGPLEDTLAGDELSEPVREHLETARRNALRMLKLVNTLLEFSRVEARRTEATFEPTDLAAFTAEVASVFRSAFERAELRLEVEAPPLAQPVFVDREMWETIVLNLTSNAFKFTLEGGVAVVVSDAGGRAVLEVRDTGVGVPADELSHLFQRFHRVRGTRARTHEGTGIGLALVQELVQLHGGTIGVDSEDGRGTTVRVELPYGSAHLAAERVRPAEERPAATARARAFVEEALATLPPPDAPIDPAAAAAVDRSPRIVLVDDNADMRNYVRRLLEERWTVDAFPDGAAALEAIQAAPPDLVLADVMMPGLDGFELLRALRAGEETRAVPVVLLSARAGEEAAVEGLAAGADDYLVKPFSAGELRARVAAHLGLAAVRAAAVAAMRVSEKRLRTFTSATSDAVYRMSGDWTELRYLEGKDFVADADGPTRGWLETYVHPDDRPSVLAEIEEAIRGKRVFALEHRVKRVDGTVGWTLSRAVPILDEHGEIVEWFGSAADVTGRKDAELALRESEGRSEQQRRLYQAILANTPDLAYIFDLDHRFVYANEGLLAMWGKTWEEAIGKNCLELGYPDWHAAMHDREIEQVKATRRPVRGEVPFAGAFGERIYDYIFVPVIGPDGQVEAVAGTTRDVTEQKQREERQAFLLELSDEIRAQPDEAAIGALCTRRLAEYLAADRCYFATFYPEEDRAFVGPEYHRPELSPITGDYRLSNFPEAVRRIQTQTLVFDDIAADPDLTEADKQALAAIDFGAYIAPAARKGDERVLWALALASTEPRAWTRDEVALVEEAAERAWAAIERARAAAEVERLADAARSLEHVGEAVVLVDPAGGVRYWNIRAAELFDLHEEVRGTAAVSALVGWDEIEAQVGRGGAVPVAFPFSTRGRERWIRVSREALEGGAVYAIEDVTDEQTLAQMASNVIATISHELRTPLSAVYGAAKTLQRGGLEASDGTRAQLLSMISTQSERLNGLVDEILLASRLDADKLPLALAAVDGVSIARDAIESIRQKHTEVSPGLAASPGLPRVAADPDKLRQVLVNLLDNAVKYSAPPARVDVAIGVEADARVSFRISDHGIGIERAEQDRIFERFHRVDPTMSNGVGGTGLGLYICRALLERMNGTISVESGVGAGSTFVITLPAAEHARA